MPMKKIRIALWGLIAFAAVIFVLVALPQKHGDSGSAVGEPIAGFNQGADFTLTDQDGNSFDTRTAITAGRYGLLFFGFTHCPAICPTELQKMATVMDALSPNTAKKVTPIFITIDPERDTVAAMKNYVPQFHPAIKGLTGSPTTIKDVLAAWKIYAAKVEDPQFSDYTMDHSTYSYLIDSDMRIIGLYRLQTTAEEITVHIEKAIKNHP